MAGDPALTDVLTADLERLYSAATRRLEALVRAGLARGLDPSRIGTGGQRAGDATLAYRQRQHEQALAVLASLRADGRAAGRRAVIRGYGAALFAVDVTLGENIRGTGAFGGIHTGAVEALAANLTASLDAAASAVGDRIGDVFERAQALEGALREDRPILKGARFIGRRHDDPWRKAALEVVGDATIGLDTRRQTSALLSRRLITEGLADGLTGLVDSSGRRWALDAYTEMVARTTTAEAVTAGTLNRLAEGDTTIGQGLDLVTITSHPHTADVCTPYDGQTYSRTGRTRGYPVLSATPPFHPRAILGDQRVEALGGFRAATRAVYSGPAVEVKSATGIRTTVSPNHPVLARRGWLPARALREGDEIVRAAGRDGAAATVPGENLDNVPSLTAEVFDALGATGASARTVAAPEDLHGDARFCEREVDVVWTDRMLRERSLSALDEQGGEPVLVGTPMQAASLARCGSPGVLIERGSAGIARPLPDGYASRDEATAEGCLGEWAAEREFLARFAVEVAVDELVEVRYVNDWHGFAYDFETGAGTYFAGSLYVHNCRHRLGPASANLDEFERQLEAAVREQG